MFIAYSLQIQNGPLALDEEVSRIGARTLRAELDTIQEYLVNALEIMDVEHSRGLGTEQLPYGEHDPGAGAMFHLGAIAPPDVYRRQPR